MNTDMTLQTLKDLEEIKKLQYTYGHYCDFGWNGKTMDYEKAAALFVEEATWGCAEQGVLAHNRKEISETFRMMPESGIEYYMHGFLNPIIDINGDTATGKWLLYLGCVIGGKGSMLNLSYDIEYVRTAEGWRFKSVKIYIGRVIQGAL